MTANELLQYYSDCPRRFHPENLSQARQESKGFRYSDILLLRDGEAIAGLAQKYHNVIVTSHKLKDDSADNGRPGRPNIYTYDAEMMNRMLDEGKKITEIAKVSGLEHRYAGKIIDDYRIKNGFPPRIKQIRGKPLTPHMGSKIREMLPQIQAMMNNPLETPRHIAEVLKIHHRTAQRAIKYIREGLS